MKYVVAAWIAIAIALLAVRPHATPGPLLRDFEAYYAAGATWADRHDPYSTDIWSIEATIPGVNAARNEVLPFVGPPWSLPLWNLFARMPYVAAARLWSILLGVALLGIVLFSLRLARIRLTFANVGAAAALAIGFAPITSDLALGQVALISLAGMLLVATTPALATATIGSALASLQPNLALPLVAFVTRRAARVAYVLTLILVGTIAFIARGNRWFTDYLHTLLTHGNAEMLSAIQQTPGAVAFGFGASEPLAVTIGRGITVIAVVAGVFVATRLRDDTHRFVACCSLVPFVAGFFHEHDYIVMYAPALWCARYADSRLRGWAFVATLLVAIDWLGLAQRPDGAVQSALLACAAALAFLSFSVPPRSVHAHMFVPIIAVALIFSEAVWVALAHAAPIWPDAMRTASTHLATGIQPVSALWADEQRRTGLMDAQPAWASLRLLSLAGSALLAYVAALSPRKEALR